MCGIFWIRSCGEKGDGDILNWWSEGFFVEKGRRQIMLLCEGFETRPGSLTKKTLTLGTGKAEMRV